MSSISNSKYKGGIGIRVSPLFYEELVLKNKQLNEYLFSNGEMKKKINLIDVTDMLAKPLIHLEPKYLVKTGRKGKRLVYEGELRL